MKLDEFKDRLNQLETNKLIDISKNYKQYGYDNETINYVHTLLADRGVPLQDLWLTGNLGNKKYERAQETFESFKKNSSTALFLYLAILVIKLFYVVHFYVIEQYPIVFLFIYTTAIISYLFFLIKSFMNQSALYHMVGDNYGTEGILIYIFGGVYFYCISYFFFLKQMKEKMTRIQ